MESGRFETFIDAILAIMMTVMVLKIPQPEPMTLGGIWNLKAMYFSYAVSFMLIFSIWDHHRKFFNIVEEIDNKVIWMYSMLIFILTLVPYFTAWVAHEPHSLVPEVMFGLVFFLVNILYVLCTHVTITNDVNNKRLNGISYRKFIILNTMLFVVGAAIGAAGYPVAMMFICLLTVVGWNVVPHFQKNDESGDA